MSDPSELFARLTCQIEDLHGIAFEGQAASLSDDERLALAAHICNGLQGARKILRQIRQALGGPR